MNIGRPCKYPVSLTEDEELFCKEMMNSSDLCLTLQNRARVLYAVNSTVRQNTTLGEVSRLLGVSGDLVTSVSKLYNEGGIESVFTLNRNPNSDVANLKLDSRAEGFLISMLCGPPPSPAPRWTVDLATSELKKLLAEKEFLKDFERTSVWRAMQRNELHPHKNRYWCIPEVTPLFTLKMEYILYSYALSHDPAYPLVCMDECAFQLIKDVREAINVGPGQIPTSDSEYQRLGTLSIFVFLEPKTGHYYVNARPRRTAQDWAYEMKYLADVVYPDAKKIIIVCDNLNTHDIQSFYKTFPAEEARRLVERFDIRYTPGHGSWLNIAEIGINVMKRQCLPKRFKEDANQSTVNGLLGEWMDKKNEEMRGIKWNYTVDVARIKHPHLYENSSSNLPCTMEKS